jgi:O-antigen ligase
METIVSSDMEGAMDRGSKEAREELLKTSLQLMAAHPLVGIGPGNFASVSGTWHVAHNTYTELGAEAGLPALFLFAALLIRARINLKRVARSKMFTHNTEIQIFTGAMWASFAAYLVGAAFADTQYELFPYFLVAYTTVLYHLACVLPDQAIDTKLVAMNARLGKPIWSWHLDDSGLNDSLIRRPVTPN